LQFNLSCGRRAEFDADEELQLHAVAPPMGYSSRVEAGTRKSPIQKMGQWLTPDGANDLSGGQRTMWLIEDAMEASVATNPKEIVITRSTHGGDWPLNSNPSSDAP